MRFIKSSVIFQLILSKIQLVMLYLITLFIFIETASAQSCINSGNGPCLNGACPIAGDTCVAFGGSTVCCPAASIVTSTTTSSTCVDLLNPTTGASDCPSRAYLCTNSVYYDLMTQQCPRTCGRCTGGVTTVPCVDLLNPSTGVSDCPSRAYLCNNAAYYTLMTQQCPRTCSRCSTSSSAISTTCVDQLNPSTGVSDCPSRSYLCTNTAYLSLMRTQCPRTCGYCSG